MQKNKAKNSWVFFFPKDRLQVSEKRKGYMLSELGISCSGLVTKSKYSQKV